MTTILALDIASRSTGWAVLKNGRMSKKRIGLVAINPKAPMGERLQVFEKEIKELIRKHSPDIVAIEDIFKGRNANTFKILSLFRGVAIKSIYDEIGKDPISIMAAQVRKLINIPNDKKIVFDKLNTKYKLNFNFENDNDIVDAIALGLASHTLEKKGIDVKSLRGSGRKKRRNRKGNKKRV